MLKTYKENKEVKPVRRNNAKERNRAKTCREKVKERVRARSSVREKERELLAEAQGVSCYPRMLCSNLLWYFCFCLCLCSALSGLATLYTPYLTEFCACVCSLDFYLSEDEVDTVGIYLCLYKTGLEPNFCKHLITD